MGEKQEKLIYFSTCGGEDPERASMPFVMGIAALAMDIKCTVALQGNAVYLAKKGYVDNVLPGGGFPHISKLIIDFLELGGVIKVCVPCIGERNIDENDLIEGAETTAAGALNIEVIEADGSLVY